MVGTLNSVVRAGQRAGLRIYLSALIFLPAVAPALDSPATLQFDVFLGHDGIVQEASWFPVVCELKNDGGSFNGVIEITGSSYNQSQTRRTTIELPTGTLKRITIPAFCSSRNLGSWDARLRDSRGKVRAERLDVRPRRQLGWETPLIAGVPRTAGGLPVLRPPLVQQQDVQPAVARWQPAIFPDNPLVLEGLDALYLNSSRAGEFGVGQIRALLDWLRGGGHLIVAVEEISEVSAAGWLRSVFPCELQTVATVAAHGELQSWLRADQPEGHTTVSVPTVSGRSANRTTVTLTNAFATLPADDTFEAEALQVATGKLKDGQVIVSSEGKPLIVTATRGRGRVTALLFSPEREPVRSWKNLPTFWSKLTEIPQSLYQSSNYQQYGGWSADGLFGAMVDSRQVRKLPVPWLLLLLVVYLLIIGPFDRWWLRKINRPMLTWITFPCYVALFSLLIYFIGYKLRAGETEWNELHIVDGLPAGERAELRGRTFASVYSPVNATYRAESKQQFASLRGEFRGSWGGSEVDDRSAVLQTGDNFKAELFVPVWTSQLYVNDWWESSPPPLTLRVTARFDGWEATVENRLDRALTSARVAIAGKVFELGDLPAKQTKTVSLNIIKGRNLRDWVSPFAGGFQNAAQSRQRALGTSAWIDNPAEASQVATFMSALGRGQNYGATFIAPPGLDLSPLVNRGQAVLLAWAADSAPVAPLNQFNPRRSHRDTLYRIATPVNEEN